MMQIAKPIAILVTAALVSGCAPAAARTAAAATLAAATSRPAATTQPAATAVATQAPAAAVTVPPEAAAVVALAQADLQQRLGLAETAIAVQSVQAQEWPDTALGCPDPNMMYAQVITPGYTVMLSAGGKAYEYHTDDSQTVVLCQDGKPAPEATASQ